MSHSNVPTPFSTPQPLDRYAQILATIAPVRGASPMEIMNVEAQIEGPLPPGVREWFTLCNGEAGCFYSLNKQRDWSILHALGSHWTARRWLPIASDGAGDDLAISLDPIAGLHPVAFFEQVEPSGPEYIVASSLERFLSAYVERDEWSIWCRTPNLSHEHWPFAGPLALQLDPELARLPTELLPWAPGRH